MVFNTRTARPARYAGSPWLWLAGLALAAASSAAQAQGSEPTPTPEAELAPPAPEAAPQWTFTFSPYVYHWKYDPEHRPAFIFSLERRVADHRLYGVALFRNSFAQPSAFAYVGWRWDQLLGQPQLSAKLAAGVIYGYVEDHLDKVPYNWNGFSPTVVPALAYWFTPRDSLEVMVLGTAALAFGYSRDF
jgi:hypothetical protein